jgi:protein ImuB
VIRLVSLRWPQWPILAAGVGYGEPAVVVHANRVIAVSLGASESGVAVGLRRREAQSRCPSVRIIERDAERDARRFEPIARAVSDLVPVLEISEPGRLTFGSRGPSRYCGGDELLAIRVGELATQAALAEGLAVDGATSPTAGVGIGVADGQFAAAVASRRSVTARRPIVVTPGRPATIEFLSPLPVRTLSLLADVDEAIIDLLIRLGIERLADFAALPPSDVLARFGTVGAFAHGLARGDDPRPPAVSEPPPDMAVTHWCDDPVVQLEPLVFLGRQLAVQLHAAVAERGAVVTRVLVEAETETDEHSVRQWHRPLGFTIAALAERVRWQLDGWVRSPGGLSSGVVLLRLVPLEIRADAGVQLGFWGGQTEADEWAARATARLVGLLGPESVCVPTAQGGRSPGQTFAALPIGTAEPATALPTAPWPGRLPAPSPACVLDDPVTCSVVDATGRPVRVSGRGLISADPVSIVIDRQSMSLTGWAGPWPLEERWWEPDGGRRRARFQLLTEQGDAYLVGLEQGRWTIDAVYA